MISVVDYGVGNLGAIENALDYLGVECNVVKTPDEIVKADKLILPGVGAFDAAVRKLREYELDVPIINSVTVRGIPILGVCLGMQLLGDSSEEGSEKGLGFISARSLALTSFDARLKVPNMGWLPVTQTGNKRLFPTDNRENCRFYFAHSFYVECEDEADVAAYSYYGKRFAAAVERGNIFGVQFHPEKSHKFGLSLLSRFSEL